MKDYPTEQRKADAETLRQHAQAHRMVANGDDLRAIADRLDPAPPPMTLRDYALAAYAASCDSTLDHLGVPDHRAVDAVLAVVADPAHRAEVLALLGEPAPQTYDADNPPPVWSLVVLRRSDGIAWATRIIGKLDWRSLLDTYGTPLAVFPPTGGAS